MMIIAAVDVSGSINYVPDYSKKVYEVLSSLDPPVRLIQWHSFVQKDKTYEIITKSIVQFIGRNGTTPQCFLKRLPTQTPIELYIFTDGQIWDNDVKECRSIIEKNDILFSQIRLHYIGNEDDMNLKFTDVFEGIPQTIYYNNEYIASVKPELINFDNVHYDDIMKDNSFKATIMTQINSSNVDKAELKNKIGLLSARILKEYFEDKLSITSFFDQQDVQGCIQYVKKHSYFDAKASFQRKISDILTLFDQDIDTHSFKLYTQTPKSILKGQQDIEDDANENEKEELLECNILYEECKLPCIPLKICEDDVWPDKQTLRNPFKLLESEFLVKRIAKQIEPYVMCYDKTYQQLANPNKSPFSRDTLQGVYLLHNDSIDVQSMIKHNNYVLSTLFQNKLPGKPILWHMIFLYIAAMEKFKDIREIFLKEIKFLGKHANYFITLSPHLNPPILGSLNCCFWYIAHVCPKAFPNSKKNVLRKVDFISGVFLKFYQDVYEKNYTYPPEMPLWQLWYTLYNDKLSIFPMLTHYYQHEEINDVESKFKIILYREMKEPDSEPSQPYPFLSQLSLKKVLDVYKAFLQNPEYYADLKVVKEQNVCLYDENDEKGENLLFHVKINPVTCHPYVICQITRKHWKECIGEYDPLTQSYLRLFKRYCEKYQVYPQSSDDLLCFLNEYLYQQKGQMPEVFPVTVKQQLQEVMDIFEEIRKLYSCKDYLICSNNYNDAEKRMKYEIA